MPRIAAAAGVLTLIVFSIGFNIARYPTVWDMVDPMSHLPQPAKSAPSIAMAESSADAQPEAAVQPTASWQPTPVPLPADAPLREVPSGARSSDEDPPDDALGETESEQPDLADVPASDKRSIWLVRSVVEPDASVPLDETARLCRLPPVDRTAAFASGGATPPAADGSIPIYPTTGIE